MRGRCRMPPKNNVDSNIKTKKRIGIGRVRNTKPISSANNDSLSEGEKRLNEMDGDGEFTYPLPIEKLTPDPRNKRQIIHFLTEHKDKICNAEYENKKLIEYIADDEYDIAELPPEAFFDLEMSSEFSDDDVLNIRDAWLKILMLARSIYNEGVTSAIKVRREDGQRDKYLITYGHRRFLANYLAGNITIPASVTNTDKRIDDLFIAKQRWSENRNNEPLSFWEEYCEFKTYRVAYYDKFKSYPTALSIASSMSLHRKLAERLSSIARADEQGLMTDKLEYSIKRGLIHQKNIVKMINDVIRSKQGPAYMDLKIDETIELQRAQASSSLITPQQSESEPSEGDQSTANTGSEPQKRNRIPSASLKIKDIEFGRRVVRALKQEFFEFGDIQIDEIESIEQIDSIMKRLR